MKSVYAFMKGDYTLEKRDAETLLHIDRPPINKMHHRLLSDNPNGIPTKNSDRNGRYHYLPDTIRRDEVGVDTPKEVATEDSCTVSASYTGEIAKTNCEAVTYTTAAPVLQRNDKWPQPVKKWPIMQ